MPIEGKQNIKTFNMPEIYGIVPEGDGIFTIYGNGLMKPKLTLSEVNGDKFANYVFKVLHSSHYSCKAKLMKCCNRNYSKSSGKFEKF